VGNKEGEVHMLDAQTQRSEVRRLLEQIGAEYEAAQRGLTGLASGTPNHAFITAKMERMSQLHTQLHDIVGDVAIAMVADTLSGCSDGARQVAQ
jgi:hypothetical protein